MGLFIPNVQKDAFKAADQCNSLYLLEDLVFIMRAFQVVVWYLGSQVMYMVKANVAAKPLQQLRKFEKGSAAQSRFRIFPFFMPAPIGIFELVLYVKKENANRGTEDHNGKPHHDQLFVSKPVSKSNESQGEN